MTEWRRTIRAWEEEGRWYEESSDWYLAPRPIHVDWVQAVLLGALIVIVAAMLLADVLTWKGYRP